MIPPAATAVRDAIRLILRERPIEMSCEEIARYLDPQLVHVGEVLRFRRLSPVEVYRLCQALAADGYLVAVPPVPGRNLPARFMWAPPQPGTPREHELRDTAVFAALASSATAGEEWPA